MTRNDRPALGRFTARYKALVDERRTNYTRLSKATGYSHAHVSNAAKGGVVPSEKLVVRLDEALGAGGELLALWDQADSERTAHRRRPRGVDTGADGGARSAEAELARLEEADDTDRRQLGGLTWAAILSAAGEASEAIATADPTPLTLEEMEDEADEIAAQIYDVPPDALLRRAGTQWHAADALLKRRVGGEARPRLLLLAGGLACRAAALGRRLDDAPVVRKFGTLARQYAAESGDPLLVGQVAGLRSRTAFGKGQYLKAATIAGAARPDAHPAQRARLAAYQAEALAAGGRVEAAQAALEDMRAESPAATHWTDGDQVIFSAVTLARLRDYVPAAELARLYVTGGDSDRQGVGWAHAAVGRCLLSGDRPDAGQAAHEGVLALGATAGPDMSVIRPVTALYADLRRHWLDVAEVSQLGEALTAARGELAR